MRLVVSKPPLLYDSPLFHHPLHLRRVDLEPAIPLAFEAISLSHLDISLPMDMCFVNVPFENKWGTMSYSQNLVDGSNENNYESSECDKVSLC